MRDLAVAGSVVFALLAAAASPGSPVLLDAASFRTEVVARLTGYTGRLDGNLRRKQKGLERALAALDSPSSSLEGDLRIVRWTAKALERPFLTDAPLLAFQDALEARVTDLVRGEREGLEACIPAMDGEDAAAEAALRLARADRRLAGAEAASTRGRRLALVAKALADLRKGLDAVEADAGEPLSTASLDLYPTIYDFNVTHWVADSVVATVTLDAEGSPLSLDIVMTQNPGGGPVTSRLQMTVASGFQGAGTYDPVGVFDHDMAVSINLYRFWYAYQAPPSGLVIDTFDVEGGRITGTFAPRTTNYAGSQGSSIKNGVFDIRAPLILRQP